MTFDRKLDVLLETVEHIERRLAQIEEFRRTERLRADSRSDWDIIYPDRLWRSHARTLH